MFLRAGKSKILASRRESIVKPQLQVIVCPGVPGATVLNSARTSYPDRCFQEFKISRKT